MRKDFFEIYRQFSHALSKKFASPDLVRSHWAVLNCMFSGSANLFVTCLTRDSLQGITITNTSCTQSIPVGQAFVTSAKSGEGKERKRSTNGYTLYEFRSCNLQTLNSQTRYHAIIIHMEKIQTSVHSLSITHQQMHQYIMYLKLV